MANFNSSWIITVLILFQWSINSATSDTFHIVTSPAAPCPGEFIGEPCLTLQQYVSNPSISNGNITLLFETGTHVISHAFSASNAHSYTLSGYNTSIQCASNAVTFTLNFIEYLNTTGLTFSNCGSFTFRSNSLTFTELAFSYCGSFTFSSNSLTFTELAFSSCSSFTFSSIANLEFMAVHFSNSGNLYIRSSTSIQWSDSVFTRNGNVQIQSSQLLHMQNCTFSSIRNCPSLSLSNVRNVSMLYSSFINNRYSHSTRCYGGALYLSNSVLSIICSVFMNNNIAEYYSIGGAVYAVKSRLTIGRSIFQNNVAYYYYRSIGNNYGGAAFIYNTITVLQNNLFTQNRAKRRGGAIYIERSPLTILNTTFRNNVASFEEGGGLFFHGNNITSDNSTFVGNRAGRSGGGLYINYANFIITNNNSYIENSASHEGGGLYITNTHTVTSCNNFFLRNTANSGGAISTRSTLSLYNTYFANNVATRYGGGIYVNSVASISIKITECTFVSNIATSEGGGAIYSNSRYSNVSLISSRFSYNSATYCSVLDVDEFYHFSVNLTDSVFTHNTATGQLIGGGVACIRNASINIMRSTFKHNYADLHGGVFYIDESVTSVAGSLFVNNSAAVDGGVFYTYVHASSYNIRRSQFTNNSAGDDGGVLFIGRVNSEVSIDESIFSWNDASDRGGVVAIIASSMFIEINRTNIFNNMASFGGIISACNSEVTVLEQELFVSEDPVYSFCTLYDGDVTYFNITSPRDLEETLPTISEVPQVSSATLHSSLSTLASSDTKIITTQFASSVDTTSITSHASATSFRSLTASNTELVENLLSSERIFPVMSPTTSNELYINSTIIPSLAITFMTHTQERSIEQSQISFLSTFESSYNSVDNTITPSLTYNNRVSSLSPISESVIGQPKSVVTSSVTLRFNLMSSVAMKNQLESVLPAILMSSVIEMQSEKDKSDILPTVYKQPDIINNYYKNNNNSLQGHITTALVCFVLIMLIVGSISLYVYKNMRKDHTSFRPGHDHYKSKLETQNYSKKFDIDNLSEKEEIHL